MKMASCLALVVFIIIVWAVDKRNGGRLAAKLKALKEKIEEKLKK